jgi:uncharacterized membrane protein
MIENFLLLLLGFGGFILAFFIYRKKRIKKPLICPLRSDCNVVINSKYSKFLGFPVEILGIVYFLFIMVLQGFFLFFPNLSVNEWFSFVSVFVSFGAFIFSLYLTAVQLFGLKQFCAWCITSAFFSFGIFYITLISFDFNLIIPILLEYRSYFVILHVLGAALGVGGATITDMLFFRFLRDYKISVEEADVVNSISQIIWVALGILFISGVALYLPATERLDDSAKFLTKLFALSVLVINGVFLNIVVAPKLSQIYFSSDDKSIDKNIRKLRRLAFSLGGISIVSWYFIFILGALRTFTLNFQEFMSIYIILLLLAIIGGNIFERNFTKIKHKEE